MKKMILILAVVSLMAGSAMAGTIVFSGETWETFDGSGTAVVGTDGVSGWVDQGNPVETWAQLGAIGLNKTYSVGDTISLTVAMSGPNTGYGTNGWSGSFFGGLSSTALDWSTAFSKTIIHEPVYAGGFALPAEGLSFDISYEFISATEATYTQDGVSSSIAVNVADVAALYYGTWNTQQNMTVSNFTFTSRVPIPTPGNGDVDVPGDQVLSWMHDDPNIVTLVGYDVYLDPNETLVNAGHASVKVSPSQAETFYDPAGLAFGTTHFWRVDVIADFDYIPGIDPCTVAGSTWSFTTQGPAPKITEFDNVRTTRDMLPAAISAVVSDGDGNVSSVSWEWLSDDFYAPAGATGTITDMTSDLYAPEAMFGAPTDPIGWYIIRLTVYDLDGNSDQRDATVQVYETACELAASEPGWTGYNYYDVDQDCDVDLNDFAAFALEWLDDRNATDQQSVNPGGSNYLPMSGGLVNGNFESTLPANGYGDLALGWWHLGAATIVEGANVYEGTYAVELAGLTEINTLTGNEGPYYNMPAGNHSLTFQYKGDASSELDIRLDGVMGQDAAPTDGADAALVASATEGRWVIEDAEVSSYVQYEVRFTVVTEGLGYFNIGNAGTGTCYLDDFQLVLDSH